MRIIDSLLRVGPHTRPGTRLNRISGIVVHDTNNPSLDVTATVRYFDALSQSGPQFGSYHYLIDLDASLHRLIPEDEVAYHAGPSSLTEPEIESMLGGKPNWRTLGVSFCNHDHSRQPTRAQYLTLIEFLADACARYALDPCERLLRHWDCTGKHCPGWLVEHEALWHALRSDVKREMI